LQEWDAAGRLVPCPPSKKACSWAWCWRLNTAGSSPSARRPSDAGRLGGYVVIIGNLLQFTSPLKEPFERLRDEVRKRSGPRSGPS
jgi:hypothetical protein